MTPEIFLGPPGTGKTTTMLSVVEQELERGVEPERVGYVSFTRRAAEEAVSRACVKFGFERKRFPFFRTLHSLCYQRLGLGRGDVLEGKRLQEFARYAGVRVSGRWSDDGTFAGFDVGDRILFMENLARIRGVPLRTLYDQDDDGLSWTEVDRVARALAQYKRERGLWDFTDMLREFCAAGAHADLEVLVVDEAQDLSHMQWQVVGVLARSARRVVIAGDDDQAIYRWAGADVDHLIDMDGDVRVLNQSWRVPRALQSVALGVIERVKHRRPKQWDPREGSEGELRRAANFGEVDTDGDDVLVLARNAYVVREQIEPELRRRGVVYELHGRASISAELLGAIRAWERLRGGGMATPDEVREIYRWMSSGARVKRGHKELQGVAPEVGELSLADLRKDHGLLVDTIWHEAMDRLPSEDMSYILAARQRGEKLSSRARPRVRVSTIHGAKGGQGHHVVIMKEMARRTHREMELNPDDEARVWYVAASRAEEKLTLVESSTQQACPWL